MTQPPEISILYPLDDTDRDCKTCLERIKEDLKNRGNLRVHFRIARYESESSSEPLERVDLFNKFAETMYDYYPKSIQINTQEECVYLFGRVDVLNDNGQTHSRIPRIYLIKFNQIFHLQEIKYTAPDSDDLIYFYISIFGEEKTRNVHCDTKHFFQLLVDESFTFNS
jgi:hypothetical protein